MTCPFQFTMTRDEVESLHWLQKVLSKIVANKEHKNYENAVQCIRSINRMNDYIFDAHVRFHDMDRDISELAERAGIEEIRDATKAISGKYGPN